eukprot:Rmarinus@m.23177
MLSWVLLTRRIVESLLGVREKYLALGRMDRMRVFLNCLTDVQKRSGWTSVLVGLARPGFLSLCESLVMSLITLLLVQMIAQNVIQNHGSYMAATMATNGSCWMSKQASASSADLKNRRMP